MIDLQNPEMELDPYMSLVQSLGKIITNAARTSRPSDFDARQQQFRELFDDLFGVRSIFGSDPEQIAAEIETNLDGMPVAEMMRELEKHDSSYDWVIVTDFTVLSRDMLELSEDYVHMHERDPEDPPLDIPAAKAANLAVFRTWETIVHCNTPCVVIVYPNDHDIRSSWKKYVVMEISAEQLQRNFVFFCIERAIHMQY